MINASRETIEGGDDQPGDKGNSSEEEWKENEVALGQELSDYRSAYHPGLASIQVASSIAESSKWEWLIRMSWHIIIYTGDSAPLVGAVVKNLSKDIRGNDPIYRDDASRIL